MNLLLPQKKIVRVGTVCFVLRDAWTGRILLTRVGANLITDNGDLFYANMAVADSAHPDDLFVNGVGGAFDGQMELFIDGTVAPTKSGTRATTDGTSIASSQKAAAATYPKINDGDANNAGRGPDVVTYRTDYLTSEANGVNITDLIITNPAHGASEKLLMWSQGFTPFTKTSSNTLTAFVNHTSTGV